MGFALHKYEFGRLQIMGENKGARIRVGESLLIQVYIGEVYLELFPKPGKEPRKLTVTSILPPSNENSGTARIGGTTERPMWGPLDHIMQKGSTSIMAYTLHSHWKKVD